MAKVNKRKNISPICACGNKAEKHSKDANGDYRYRKGCEKCRKGYHWKYQLYRKSFCEYCGFVAINICQLDIHHIDGNHFNNNPNNLMTLCANCHRLEMLGNKDKKLKVV